MDLGEIATFPMEDDDWIVTILIGGVLTVLGFLIVPLLLVWGYVVEAIRGGANGATQPPEFDDWGGLAVDGVKAIAVLIAYQIVPAVLGIGLFVVFGLAGAGTDSAGLGILGFFLGFGLWGILSLVFGYFAFAGVVNFAVEDSLGAAFDFGALKEIGISSEFLMAWAFYIGMSIAASIVSFTIIVAPFASFYVLSASGRAFGEAYAATAGSTTATGTEADAPTPTA